MQRVNPQWIVTVTFKWEIFLLTAGFNKVWINAVRCCGRFCLKHHQHVYLSNSHGRHLWATSDKVFLPALTMEPICCLFVTKRLLCIVWWWKNRSMRHPMCTFKYASCLCLVYKNVLHVQWSYNSAFDMKIIVILQLYVPSFCPFSCKCTEMKPVTATTGDKMCK